MRGSPVGVVYIYGSNPSSHTGGAHSPCAWDLHPMSVLVLQDKVLGPEGILEGIPGEMALSLDHEELASFLFL